MQVAVLNSMALLYALKTEYFYDFRNLEGWIIHLLSILCFVKTGNSYSNVDQLVEWFPSIDKIRG